MWTRESNRNNRVTVQYGFTTLHGVLLAQKVAQRQWLVLSYS
jgi:hypothetical protein